MKVLALHAHNGGLIHTRDKQVVTMADLKGLRIRFPSAPIKAMLESLGAVPQGLPPGKVYENTQKGVIDGTVFPWDPMHSFKLSEVMNYHLDMGGIYTVSFWFAMNEKKYNSLPADVRKVIDDMSGDNLIGKFGPWWDKWTVGASTRSTPRARRSRSSRRRRPRAGRTRPRRSSTTGSRILSRRVSPTPARSMMR